MMTHKGIEDFSFMTQEDWADEIGADGYAPDAAAAVELCKTILAR
jgi:methanogenic corrinoid protein MtbC1